MTSNNGNRITKRCGDWVENAILSPTEGDSVRFPVDTTATRRKIQCAFESILPMSPNRQQYQGYANAMRSREHHGNPLVTSTTPAASHTIHFNPSANTGNAIRSLLERRNEQPSLFQKNTLESGIDHQKISIHPELTVRAFIQIPAANRPIRSLVSSVLFHFFSVMDEMEPGESRIERCLFICSTR